MVVTYECKVLLCLFTILPYCISNVVTPVNADIVQQEQVDILISKNQAL